MARIVEFTVLGLVGRDEPLRQQLNRHVNVFFGLNGSGKTSLLKILHSALLGDTSIMRGVVFDRAEVKILSVARETVITRTLTRARGRQQEELFPSYSEEFAKMGISPEEYATIRQREMAGSNSKLGNYA